MNKKQPFSNKLVEKNVVIVNFQTKQVNSSVNEPESLAELFKRQKVSIDDNNKTIRK